MSEWNKIKQPEITKKRNVELEAVREKIYSMYESNQKALQKVTEELEALEKSKEKALNDIADAQTSVDKKAYAKAKSDLWAINQSIELYSTRKEKLEKETLITKEEYKKLFEEVSNALDEYNLNKAKPVIELINQLETHKQDIDSVLVEGREILTLLGTKVYREGKSYASIKYYKGGSLRALIKKVSDDPLVKTWKERIENE